MEPVERLLCDLVSIPSMNPMGRSRTGQDYCEEQLADFVGSYLRARRIDVEVREVAPHRPNVIGYVDAGAHQTILIEAHLDTVHADNMAIGPFQPKILDGKLYGRGSCDTKGSMAAFLRAVCSFVERSHKPKHNVIIAAVADEEYGFTGARQLADYGLKADFGIAGEPTRLHIVRAHKGVTRWRVVAHGKAAHSAYPQRGENAIYTMGRILTRLEEYAGQLVEAKPHPSLGTPTLSVGVIEGGQAVNIVPDRCWVEVDRRTLPGESEVDVLEPVERVLREIRGWTFDAPHLVVPGMEVKLSAPVTKALVQAVTAVTGGSSIETASYATDAGIYNAKGIPTVVFGPGDIAQAHTDSEFIELKQVYQAVDIITRLLEA